MGLCLSLGSLITRCGLAAVLLIVPACRSEGIPAEHKNRPGVLPHAGLHPTPLEGVVVVPSERFASPTRLALTKSYLVVADAAADSVLHLYSRTDGSFIRSLGRHGEGPGEFRGVWSISGIDGDAAWFYDFRLRRLTYLDLRPAVDDFPRPGPTSLQLNVGVTLLDPVLRGDTIVALGFFSGGRMGVFNRAGDLVREAGPMPGDTSKVPYAALQHAFQSFMAARPDRAMLAVATRHAGRIEVYDSAGNSLRLAATPFSFEPFFRVVQVDSQFAFTSDDDLRFGYVGLAVSQECIIGLFSGRTRWWAPGVANFGRHLHVFGWDGGFRGAYALDADLISIAFDDRTGALYGVRHEPEPGIVAYRDPGLSRCAYRPGSPLPAISAPTLGRSGRSS